jgi:hypothetical protein
VHIFLLACCVFVVVKLPVNIFFAGENKIEIELLHWEKIDFRFNYTPDFRFRV